MKLSPVAAVALLLPSALNAQTATTSAAPSAQAMPDLSTATPLTGQWVYSSSSGGSAAVFTDESARPQLTIRCTRLSRQVTIAKPATAASPTLNVWTATQVRSLPASFDAATQQLSVSLAAFDPSLDAIAYSRGRLGIGLAGAAPLVVPAWADVARVVEDCRV
ncbi:MAG TPA: hypothetical protein VIV07_03475 [Sphingomicrobium sp.]